MGCLWLRVSDDKGQDVEGQERDLRAAAERMGLTIPDEFVFRLQDETAHSVFRGDPPEKKQVLALAKKRKFDVLLVWALDRWARRRKDGLREVFDTLPACGVTVFSHEEPFLTTEGIPDFARESIASALLWLAEEDSKRKSRRVRTRYETNRNRASAGGGRAKWGRGRVPTLEDVSEIERLRFEEGLSVRAIEAATGIPKSTVSRVVSQSSRADGGQVSSEAQARPNGTLGTGRKRGLGRVEGAAGGSEGVE